MAPRSFHSIMLTATFEPAPESPASLADALVSLSPPRLFSRFQKDQCHDPGPVGGHGRCPPGTKLLQRSAGQRRERRSSKWQSRSSYLEEEHTSLDVKAIVESSSTGHNNNLTQSDSSGGIACYCCYNIVWKVF